MKVGETRFKYFASPFCYLSQVRLVRCQFFAVFWRSLKHTLNTCKYPSKAIKYEGLCRMHYSYERRTHVIYLEFNCNLN
jgi:hypothetical protein